MPRRQSRAGRFSRSNTGAPVLYDDLDRHGSIATISMRGVDSLQRIRLRDQWTGLTRLQRTTTICADQRVTESEFLRLEGLRFPHLVGLAFIRLRQGCRRARAGYERCTICGPSRFALCFRRRSMMMFSRPSEGRIEVNCGWCSTLPEGEPGICLRALPRRRAILLYRALTLSADYSERAFER